MFIECLSIPLRFHLDICTLRIHFELPLEITSSSRPRHYFFRTTVDFTATTLSSSRRTYIACIFDITSSWCSSSPHLNFELTVIRFKANPGTLSSFLLGITTHLGKNSISLRLASDVTVRFTSESPRTHDEFTSMPLRFHFDVTSLSL